MEWQRRHWSPTNLSHTRWERSQKVGFDLIFQGVKPFEEIHEHEGVAFMAIKFWLFKSWSAFSVEKINLLVMFVTWVSEVLTSGEEDIEALLGAERQMKHSSRVLSLGARSLQTDIQNSWSVMLSDLSYWPPCWPDVASLNCTFFCRKLNSLSGRGQPQSYKSLLMDQLEKRKVRKLRTDKNADSFLNKKPNFCIGCLIFLFAPVTR